MVKGKGRGTRSSAKGSRADDVEARNADRPVDASRAESGDEGAADGGGGAAKEKKAKPLMARDAELDAELEAQFGDKDGLSRKQREEIEEQEQKRKEEKQFMDGETAKADMERLAEVRKRREDATKAKEQAAKDAEEKAKLKVQKDEQKDKQHEVAKRIAELAAAAKDGCLTLNQLNQDAGCKKILKPLCKKEGVKAINAKWLSQFPDILEVEQEGKDMFLVYPKKKGEAAEEPVA